MRMKKVSFSYGDETIPKENSFEFDQQDKYVIVGESGSGKSTVLKLLMGLLPGYEGDISYNEFVQRDSDAFVSWLSNAADRLLKD